MFGWKMIRCRNTPLNSTLRFNSMLRPEYSGVENAAFRSIRRVLLQILLLMLALIPCATAAQQPGQPAPATAGAWRISGKVVDALSGAPLSRCSVGINPVTEDGSSRSLPSGSSRSLLTGDDGQFTFDGLPTGKYTLTAAKRGYLTQSYEEHGSFSTAIAVGPELKSEGLIFKAIPQAILSGVVTDESGEPVRQAQVRLFADQDRNGLQATQQRQRVMTDDRGIYEIANVGPGNYYLAVSAQPWYAHGRQPVQMSDREEEQSNFPLDVAYPTTFYPGTTDSDEATPIPIKGGERIEVNLTLTAQPAMHLRVKLPVQDPEHAGAYNVVMSQSVFGQMEQLATGMQRMRNGVLEVDGVLPGHYDVTLMHFAPGGGPPESKHFSADVASGTTQLTADTDASEVTVIGKVTSPEGKVPSAGILFQVPHQRRVYTAMLNQAGEFTVAVPPGEYEIIGQIPKMYLAHIASQDGEVKGHILQVKAGTTPRLEIVASRGFGQIDGVVRRGGQPASGIMVLLAPVDSRFLFRRDQSDSDGTFTLRNIVPGRYLLLAIDGGWDLEWANPSVLDVFLKKSIPIEVHANDKLTQTVEVQSR
jgi:protocatechuate 3,4-dioxygenase beta subunit